MVIVNNLVVIEDALSDVFAITESRFNAIEHFTRFTIRIYLECEGRIEKIHPEGHRLASRVLPSDDKR